MKKAKKIKKAKHKTDRRSVFIHIIGVRECLKRIHNNFKDKNNPNKTGIHVYVQNSAGTGADYLTASYKNERSFEVEKYTPKRRALGRCRPMFSG